MKTKLPITKKAEQQREATIESFKQLYILHLARNPKSLSLLPSLSNYYHKLKANKPPMLFSPGTEYYKLTMEIESFLKQNWGEQIVLLFTKEIEAPVAKHAKDPNEGKWEGILRELGRGFKGLQQNAEAKWQHQQMVLTNVYHAIRNYGLHSKISERNPAVYKRFNLLVRHFYRNREQPPAYYLLLTYQELEERFLKLYRQKKRVKFGGVLIPFERIHSVRITTSMLKNDEIPLFAKQCGFRWTDVYQDEHALIDSCLDETETYHPNPDEDSSNLNILWGQVDIASTFLSKYPSARKQFDKAIRGFTSGSNERSILDDARLALELFLKEFFGNSKPLEKQLEDIGQYQKKKGSSPEIVNMFQKLLDGYSKYQNTYVKHNDAVKPDEIDLILNLTAVFLVHFSK